MNKKYFDYELDGIDTSDYPDFCDAFIVSAMVELPNGEIRKANQKELDELNDNSSLVYDLVIAELF